MSKVLLTNKKELDAMRNAFLDWLQSQQIAYADATYMCATIAGYALGRTVNNKEQLDRGIKLIQKVIRANAEISFKLKDEDD